MYDTNSPVCLSGEGDAPPEDVGGPDGDAEMLRTLSTPKDPEYLNTKTWIDGLRCKPFKTPSLKERLKVC